MNNSNIKNLEESLIVVGEWVKAHPTAQHIAMSLSKEYGGSIGIGYTEQLGWYVLHQQIGDTYIAWREL